MANIAILNYCNQKCPYCFADDMIHEEHRSISLENFGYVLGFLANSQKGGHIGIIGGEPTLHPHFDAIMKEVNRYCRERGASATLFTNGTNLSKYMPLISDRIGILVNINAPSVIPRECWDKTMAFLDEAQDLCWFDHRVSLGCNVYPTMTDYSWMWEIVEKYHITHLRTSVVSPGGCFEDLRSDKEAYFKSMVPIFVEHCKNAIKHNCRLGMDCGHIPLCYFTAEEREIVEQICDNYHPGFCTPVVDINPDLRATACFGTYDTVDITQFSNYDVLERYLYNKKTLPRAEANATGRCATCKKHELYECQGGCLGFAEV